MTNRRIDIKAILANPEKRRELLVRAIIAIQALEGIDTTRKEAEEAYDSCVGLGLKATELRLQQRLQELAHKMRPPGRLPDIDVDKPAPPGGVNNPKCGTCDIDECPGASWCSTGPCTRTGQIK
jgi:hypothetical protein